MSAEGPDPAAEASIRGLIASGDHQNALERAKAVHKSCGTAASEALLVDAYAERIRSLLRRELAIEARALVDLVRKRYPRSAKRLDGLSSHAARRPVSTADLVAPLADPDLAPDRRSAIEQAIKRDLVDLAQLARCEALPAGHSLRLAAAALEGALAAVTSGPVAEETLRLPEVSRRSPLAPWKPLVRAIASFYATDDEACRQHLEAIEADSAPSRLVPAIGAMLGGDGAALTPAAAALRAQVGGPSEVERVLHALEDAFRSGKKPAILKAIRTAVQAFERASPAKLCALEQIISVRCAMARFHVEKVRAAMGGPSRHDATFLQLFARGMEEAREPGNPLAACAAWEQFREAAVQEGWFAAGGPEVAALALRVAGLLQALPAESHVDLERLMPGKARPGRKGPRALTPEDFFRRACTLDPHPEAFEQWMEWISRQPGRRTEEIAELWHKLQPREMKPLLHLLNASEARGSIDAALRWAAKIEQIDPLHMAVRRVRIRLLAARALRHVRAKPLLAERDLVALAALPEAKQGDWPAFAAAGRAMLAAMRGGKEQASAELAELDRLLGRAAAQLLFSAVAVAARQRALAGLRDPAALTPEEQRSLPAAVARVWSLISDVGMNVAFTKTWMLEAARQFPCVRDELSANQLETLGQAALASRQADFAYAVSAAGLERPGPAEARFLLLRAASVRDGQRRFICTRAAVELGREAQDSGLVERAVRVLGEFPEFGDLSLDAAQAREVLLQERAEPRPPRRARRGPDYSRFFPLCQCPACRAERGEGPDLFAGDPDDDLDEEDFPFGLPADLPPELEKELAREVAAAARRGDTFEQMVERLISGGRPARKRRRRRAR